MKHQAITFKRTIVYYSAIYISFLYPSIAYCNKIILSPLSIRNGIESQISIYYPLKNQNKIYLSKYYKENNNLAEEVGIDLSNYLEKGAVAKYDLSKEKFFLLFYNLAETNYCPYNYLIQRVKVNKKYYNRSGNVVKESNYHLVEVMKTKNGKIKRADGHIKKYSLGNSYKRKISVTCEIGCGKIDGVLDSKYWPYGKSSLYELLQDYSQNIGMYNKVYFKFYNKYSYSFDFSKDGQSNVKFPAFVN